MKIKILQNIVDEQTNGQTENYTGNERYSVQTNECHYTTHSYTKAIHI